jgi:hypothetical protein
LLYNKRVSCFQYQEEAYKFYQDLTERLKTFNLEVAEDKSKVIAFGKNSLNSLKPMTFDFLVLLIMPAKARKVNFG